MPLLSRSMNMARICDVGFMSFPDTSIKAVALEGFGRHVVLRWHDGQTAQKFFIAMDLRPPLAARVKTAVEDAIWGPGGRRVYLERVVAETLRANAA